MYLNWICPRHAYTHCPRHVISGCRGTCAFPGAPRSLQAGAKIIAREPGPSSGRTGTPRQRRWRGGATAPQLLADKSFLDYDDLRYMPLLRGLTLSDDP